MRILVTGAYGFVGKYTMTSLEAAFGRHANVIPTYNSLPAAPVFESSEKLDITDSEAVAAAIGRIRPTHIIHLAGLSTIAMASAHQELAWEVHLFGTLNIARAIELHSPDCVLLYVGSGQIYGASARSGQPMDEGTLVAPTNVQMVSKAAADLALGAMAEKGLRCLRFRPFNHTGPNQSEEFVLPSFAMQIARIKAGKQPALMRVGDLDAERDFTDVRDVADAYVKAIAKSDILESGMIFNIASGTPRRIRDLLDELIRISGTEVVVKADQGRVRPNDIRRFVGDATRARNLLEWRPNYSLEQTLHDIWVYSERAVKYG